MCPSNVKEKAYSQFIHVKCTISTQFLQPDTFDAKNLRPCKHTLYKKLNISKFLISVFFKHVWKLKSINFSKYSLRLDGIEIALKIDGSYITLFISPLCVLSLQLTLWAWCHLRRAPSARVCWPILRTHRCAFSIVASSFTSKMVTWWRQCLKVYKKLSTSILCK